MIFSRFSHYLQKLEATPSRLDMTEILAELFLELDNNEIPEACYLMQGGLVPNYESLEFQLSVKMVVRSLAKYQSKIQKQENQNNGDSLFSNFDDFDDSALQIQTTLEKRYKSLGDVGELALLLKEELGRESHDNAQDLSETQPTILEVYRDLVEIAKESGIGSQERKLDLLVDLFGKIDAVSAKFIARIIVGKLRLGFSTMTMFDALSWAKNGDKSLSAELEDIYQKKADIGKLSQAFMISLKNKSEIRNYELEIGIPVVPALCQRLNSSEEIIEKMGEVLAEPKYDGLRIQIHVQKADQKNPDKKSFVKAFTRNLENVTHMFPELNEVFSQLDCQNCILDAEAIGFNSKSGELLAFQDTITRKRKHGVNEQAQDVPIRFYVFDMMMLDDSDLLETPLLERKKILEKIVMLDKSKPLFLSPYVLTKDAQFLHKFHNEQLAQGLEGAVIKKIDSLYKSGRKGWRWVKIKEEEGSRGKLADTLDCIVMGYYYGRGKRSGFGIGAFLVGILGKNDSGELEIQTLAKIGTGLSDDQFKEIKTRADQNISRSKSDGKMANSENISLSSKPKLYNVHKNLAPDVWIEPTIVVEIAGDELTRSPVHSAGKALRFPRLVRFRDDKSWEQATTVGELGDF